MQFDLEQASDQLTEVTQLRLGSLVEGDVEELSQGFSLSPLLSNESIALEPPNFVNCKIRLISTNDGKSVADESTPIVTSISRASRHYACSTQGLWHILELRADEVGEAFRLHDIGLTAVYAGTLS